MSEEYCFRGVTIRCGGMLARNVMRSGMLADALLLDEVDDGVIIRCGGVLARKAMGRGCYGGRE